MQNGITRSIGYRFGPRLLFLLPALAPLIFSGALIFIAFHPRSPSTRIPFLLAAAALVVLWAVTPLSKSVRRLFSPAFVIRQDGIILPSGVLINWTCIRDVVVFRHCGHRHFGVRLKGDVKVLDGEPLDKVFRGDVNWSTYQMPLVMLLNAIRIPADDLFRVLHDEFGLPIHVEDKEIEVGKEKSLSETGQS